MTFQVAILAGGLATRLYPITREIPKSMVTINGRPFIQWQLELLATAGVSDVLLCLGYKAKEIVEFVGNGKQFGLKVEYSIEKSQLGTGGAIKHAQGLLGEVFGVLYGDSYLLIEYLDVFERFKLSDKLALMTVFMNTDKWDESNVLVRPNGTLYYSKKHKSPEMKYIDYGFNILSYRALSSIPTGVNSDLSDTLEALSRKEQLEGFEVHKRFYEIGSFNGIVELEEHLRRR